MRGWWEKFSSLSHSADYHLAVASTHRRDLYNAIEAGAYPKWDFGIQVIPEEDEHKFDFDLLDSTKLVPEELYPVKNIGVLELNQNPTNYFSETEQVAFCTQHVSRMKAAFQRFGVKADV